MVVRLGCVNNVKSNVTWSNRECCIVVQKIEFKIHCNQMQILKFNSNLLLEIQKFIKTQEFFFFFFFFGTTTVVG